MATEVTEAVCEVTSVLTLSIFVEKGGIVATWLLGFTETRGRPLVPVSPVGCIWVGLGPPGVDVSLPLRSCSRTSLLPCRGLVGLLGTAAGVGWVRHRVKLISKVPPTVRVCGGTV